MKSWFIFSIDESVTVPKRMLKGIIYFQDISKFDDFKLIAVKNFKSISLVYDICIQYHIFIYGMIMIRNTTCWSGGPVLSYWNVG